MRKIYFLLLISINAFTQTKNKPKDNTQSSILRLKNGSLFYGKVVSSDSTDLKFVLNKQKTVILLNENIDSIKLHLKNNKYIVGKIGKKGEISLKGMDTLNVPLINVMGIDNENKKYFTIQNTYANSYFLTSSAFNLKKREFAYQNKEIIGNYLAYGITNDFSLSLGFTKELEVTFSQKYSFKTGDNVRFGLQNSLDFYQLLHYNLGDWASRTVFNGFLVGVVTIGNSDDNITIGIGKSYNNLAIVPNKNNYTEEFKENLHWGGNYYSFAGVKRVSNRIAIFVENIFLFDEHLATMVFRYNNLYNIRPYDKYYDLTYFIEGGIKIIGKHTVVDLGVSLPKGDVVNQLDYKVYPLLGFQYRF